MPPDFVAPDRELPMFPPVAYPESYAGFPPDLVWDGEMRPLGTSGAIVVELKSTCAGRGERAGGQLVRVFGGG